MASSSSPTSPKVYVFDLDGVLYRGDDAVDGAAETIARLRSAHPPVKLYFLTNNSSQTRKTYIEKLTKLGMPCSEEEMVTSGSATAAYISETLKPKAGSVAFAVGGPGIVDELQRVGLTVRQVDTPGPGGEHIDFVVAGLDRDFKYETLNLAQQAILAGAKFIATNRDGQFPLEGGKVIPGGGAMVAAIEASTDVTPTVIGKPEPLGLQTILKQAGCQPEDAVMIGDRLDTDILCGNRIGVPTVLVLTGVTTPEMARAAASVSKPGRIIQNLREL